MDGGLIEINELAVEWCGYTREEVLGRPFWETPWWRGSEEMQDRIRTATTPGGAAEASSARRSATGLPTAPSASSTSGCTRSSTDWATSASSIRPESTSPSASRRSSASARSSRSSPTSPGQPTRWAFRRCAAGVGRVHGPGLEEYQGLGWLDAVHPDDQASVRTAWARATASGDLFQATGRLWHAASGRTPARRRPRDSGTQPPGRRRRVGRRLHGHPRANARRRGAARAGGGGARDCESSCSGRSCPDHLVSAPRLALAAHYEAGSDVLEVGGDWYDAFQLPDGRVGLTVGDVVGHGLAAAAAMGQLRTALAALAQHADSPGHAPQPAGRVPRTDADDRLRDGLLRGARSGDRRDRVRLGRPPADADALARRDDEPGWTAHSRRR